MANEYFMLSDNHILKLIGNEKLAISNLDRFNFGLNFTSVEMNPPAIPYHFVRPDGRYLISSFKCDDVRAYEIVNDEFKLVDSASYKNISPSGEYKFGLQHSDYPKSGDHWVLFANEEVILVPKSQPSITLGSEKLKKLIFEQSFSHRTCCMRSELEADIYYAAFFKLGANAFDRGLRIVKVQPGKPQELIKSLDILTSSVKCIHNHGRKVKYDPVFITRNTEEFLTITLLPPEVNDKLMVIQKELSLKTGKFGLHDIDGKFLLEQLRTSSNFETFIRHGISPQQLLRDLLEAFK